MTPAKQLFTNADDARPVGDCFRTCLAMLLDLEPASVPHFVDEYLHYPQVSMLTYPGMQGQVVDVPRYLAEAQRWLRNRHGKELASYGGGPPAGYTGWVMTLGDSPRGDYGHAVIVYAVAMDDGTFQVRNGADPHPSDDYLAGAPTDYCVLQEATS